MATAVIIGSGPAAAGAALALSRREDLEITVVDIGLQLEAERQNAVDTLASTDPSGWNTPLAESISAQPVSSKGGTLPQKRSYGSDYPFRDVGQLDGLSASADSSTSLISAAYGGFSTVWGSQLMPFSDATFNRWPFGADAIRPHYRAVLKQIPFAGEEDDLAKTFPLLVGASPLPGLSRRSQWVLDAYDRHRSVLRSRGITMGKARLAFDAASCVRCAKCMTGCPYSLIYSSAQTLDTLRRSTRIKYHGDLMALKVVEDADRAFVLAQDLATGRTQRFEADRIFVACGAVATTRLVANSLGLFESEVDILESQQFILPMLSLRGTADPRSEPDFTLNQFNMTVGVADSDVDLSQLHFYTYNPSFMSAFPPALAARWAEPAAVQLLQRLSVALGYLPSWRSPRLRLRVRPPAEGHRLPELQVARGAPPPSRNQMLRAVIAGLSRSAPLLDLYPVLPMLRLAAGGKSYHVGGTFPHSNHTSTIFTSDRLGRVGPWKRIHLVDAAVFPSVPAMTFTLTIMANAHRIASETLDLPS